ncbi:MAG: beta-propeller fold lactonase family protein [Legionellaceae bacterium]
MLIDLNHKKVEIQTPALKFKGTLLMIKQALFESIAVGTLSLLLMSPAQAGTQPKFTIIPLNTNGNNVHMSSAGITSVIYQVTNKTALTRTLTTESMMGVSINPGPVGACANPFTLATGESCLLNLTLNGSQMSYKGIHGGPRVCKTMGSGENNPSPFLCSQPSQSNDLAVTMHEPIMYVGNFFSNSISKCIINNLTGDLICSDSGAIIPSGNGVQGIAINSTGTQIYILEYQTGIFKCSIDVETGNLSACTDTGATGFTGNNLQDIKLNLDNTKAYVASFSPAEVYLCDVNPVTGDFSSCADSGATTGSDSPQALAFNAANTIAYIATSGTTVYQCNVNASTGGLESCGGSGATDVSNSYGITLNTLGTLAYITNSAGSGSVTVCDVNPTDGSLYSCSNTSPTVFNFPLNIALNSDQTLAYVENYFGDTVSKCAIDVGTGNLSSCVDSGAQGLDGPHGMVMR